MDNNTTPPSAHNANEGSVNGSVVEFFSFFDAPIRVATSASVTQKSNKLHDLNSLNSEIQLKPWPLDQKMTEESTK